MKGFWAIVFKEWIHIRRDPSILFFALVIPCIQITILGFAFDFDVRHLATAVADHSRSRESREYIQSLQNTQYVKVTHYASGGEEASNLIRSGKCRIAVIIPPDFERNPKALILLDGSDAQVASRASAALRGKITVDPNSPSATVRILYNPGGETRMFTIPGLIGVILQICTVVLTSLSLVKEKENGTMEQMMVTPVGKFGLMLGKMTPYAVMAMLDLPIILFAARLLFNITVKGSFLELVFMTIPFVLATLALGLLISIMANNQGQALQMVVILLIPSILLSGFIFPLDNVPAPLYIISQIMPTTHYMQILRSVIIRGVSLQDLWTPTLILWLMAAALTVLAAKKFSKSVS
ncbi:ABC transporter permease [bacterium]|nr:ABC transporter permease [bacterium]